MLGDQDQGGNIGARPAVDTTTRYARVNTIACTPTLITNKHPPTHTPHHHHHPGPSLQTMDALAVADHGWQQ
jgi:hypothetical protein